MTNPIPTQTETSLVGEGELPQSSDSPIEEAKKVKGEIELLLSKIGDERKRIEKAMGEALVSGRGISTPPPQKKEETPQEYAKRVMSGQI